ncbi:pre-B-cell leukemia transcription factor-interacting protein 1 [Tachyglossus aculeatus]|uniref:pre-B-cell leukemia transcription factor-interacting protein 1 n=1 Tax=Tachyglossus aculeatus TaxID=9261 RepID=UPI0018F3CDEE|nr:pre-B-cell leukemia transcription factor-interacting protein 1 [Tachyglossus aculeatus]
MAAHPDADNSWVLAGSEGLPVETLGPGDAPGTPSKPGQAGTAPTSSEMGDPGPPAAPAPQAATSKEAESGGIGGETPAMESQWLKGEAEEEETKEEEEEDEGQRLPDVGKTGQPKEVESPPGHSSSEEDVEGLRRRPGRAPAPSVLPTPQARGSLEDSPGEEAGGWGPGAWLTPETLGVAALLGLGLLIFAGGLSENSDGGEAPGLVENLPPWSDSVPDAQQAVEDARARVPPGEPEGLRSLDSLLDRLARESQDIRLMQAELQAQKEELRGLMLRKTGPGEEAEVRGLREALRALEAEVRALRRPPETPAPPPPWGPARPPDGCSGVSDCARREGLEPVRAEAFRALLAEHLGGLVWVREPARLLARLLPGPDADGPFGPDGLFRHDRRRFRDFVDGLDDALEDLARERTGDEDAAGDFEAFVFRRLLGRARPQKRWAKKKGKKEKKDRSPWKDKDGRSPRKNKDDRSPWKDEDGQARWKTKEDRSPWKNKEDRSPRKDEGGQGRWKAEEDRSPWKNKDDRSPWKDKDDRSPWKDKDDRSPWKDKDDRSPSKNGNDQDEERRASWKDKEGRSPWEDKEDWAP